ncbi:MAG: type II secretion system major pseudopilin GspG [Parahaliea sp.]
MKSAFTLGLATLLLLGGCVNIVHDADKAISQALDNQGEDYQLLGTKQYGNHIVCGTYRTFDSWGKPGGIRRFIYRDSRLYMTVSSQDQAVFCSDSPEDSLEQQFGIVLDNNSRASYRQLMKDMYHLSDALERYYSTQSYYPTTEQGLQALVSKPTNGLLIRKYPDKAYLGTLPQDPWGQAYQYEGPEFAGAKTPFTLWSLGADGKPGGKGLAADVRFDMLPYLEYAAERL